MFIAIFMNNKKRPFPPWSYEVYKVHEAYLGFSRFSAFTRKRNFDSPDSSNTSYQLPIQKQVRYISIKPIM